MITIYNKISTKSHFFKEIEQLYINSFPKNERRDIADFEQIAEKDSRFSILGIKNSNQLLGFISFWRLSGFVYVEHFAVVETIRNQGIGSQAIDHFVSEIGTPVILETELPTDDLTRRRIDFYKRHGFQTWPSVPYIQPPYSPDRSPIELLLMTHGFTTEQQVLTAAQEIHQVVYQNHKTA